FQTCTGISLLLDRLSFPRSLLDLRLRNDRFPSALSRMTTYMMHLVFAAAKSQILFSRTTTPERLNRFVKAFLATTSDATPHCRKTTSKVSAFKSIDFKRESFVK
ncbi:hypothetical protein JG687_00013584, partial [Phytophthora cactorum]